MLDVLKELVSAIENRDPVALATVINVGGASPARVGSKLLVRPDGRCMGNVGGGELEKRVREACREALLKGAAKEVCYSLREEGEDAIGTLCGGDVTVFMEPYLNQPVLLIVGGGHIGRPLSEIARLMGYDVKIVDMRTERGGL